MEDRVRPFLAFSCPACDEPPGQGGSDSRRTGTGSQLRPQLTHLKGTGNVLVGRGRRGARAGQGPPHFHLGPLQPQGHPRTESFSDSLVTVFDLHLYPSFPRLSTPFSGSLEPQLPEQSQGETKTPTVWSRRGEWQGLEAAARECSGILPGRWVRKRGAISRHTTKGRLPGQG